MSIAANYIYNVLYQLIAMIIPFITVPYVSRVLGAESVGINAYAGSILQYFALFGSLGIGLYAGRTVAYIRDDREKLSKNFWSIFLLQFSLCAISFILYITFVIFFIDNYKLIYVIQALNILAIAIDIGWLFVGIEDFRKLITRSILLRILGVICVFLLVKSKNDLWKYTAISAISSVLGQVVMWVYLHRIVDRVKVKYLDAIEHLKPSFELFLPQVAIQVYLVLNKTMLGLYANKQEVGLYESSDKVIKMSLAVITAIGGVMLPRISNCFARGDKDKVDHYFYLTLNFVSYLSIPMMLGLIGISNQFVPWFLGYEFAKCRTLIAVLSPIVMAIAWSNVIGFQYMVPTGKTAKFTISVCIGAVINFILNLLLIRNFYSIGAAVATTIAEVAVTGTQLYLLRKDINVLKLYRNLGKYYIASLIMFISVMSIGYSLGSSAKTTLIQVISGIFIYVFILCLLKSYINNYILSKVLRKLYRRLIHKEAGI